MVQRKGEVIALVVDNVRAWTLTREAIRYVKGTANVFTDQWLGYNIIKKIYNHSVINHGSGEYVR